MKKKRRHAQADVAEHSGADVEAAVRAAAKSIAKRFKSAYPPFEDLADDDEFLRASGQLAVTDVPFATVARLGRSSEPILAAMAHRAALLRDDVPSEWLEW